MHYYRGKMKTRRIMSLTAMLAFIIMVLTSIILYIVPQGRVAYWADWRLWGLTKTDWGNIHISLGLLFLIALSFHTYYNWKPIVSYLKNKAKQVKVFTPEFNVALVVTIVFVLGAYFMVPPISWIMTLNEHFKDAGAQKYGEPPYGHAELSSLETFMKKMNLDPVRSLELLDQAGYKVTDREMTLEKIAHRYNVPPQVIYAAIKPAALKPASAVLSAGIAMPESPPPGTGNLTLADLCAQYNVNMKTVVRELQKQGIVASEKQTIKAIAANNQTSPTDLYEKIKAVAKAASASGP